MATMEKNVDAGGIMKNITLNFSITGLKVMKIRVYIGTKILILGAKIMGCGIDIETDKASEM